METAAEVVLRQVEFLRDLDECHLRRLAAQSRRRTFSAGETLFHEGDAGHTLYVIVSGRVNVQTVTPAGDLVHIAARGRGETLGEMSLIDGSPRMADAVTAVPTEMLMLDRETFIACLRESPEMALGIIACLSRRLRQAAEQVKRLQSQDVLGRVAAILLECLEREGAGGGGSAALPHFSQQQIAEQAGATRESVNRALSRLRQSGAIEIRGRTLIVHDPARLRQYSRR